MSINTARLGLITQEFRFREAYDATVDSRYTKARVMEIQTHLDMALTPALVSAMFGVVSAARRRFVVEINDTDYLGIDDFAGGCPLRYLIAPEVGVPAALACIVTRMTVDEDAIKTSLELWG